jgi:hypothetical protein
MQNVSAQWTALFNAPHKTEYRFDIDGVSYIGQDVKDTPVIIKPLLDVPAIGRVCTGSLKVSIYPKQDIPKAASIEVYCRLRSADGNYFTEYSEWLPLGKYYVFNRSGDKIITLNCLDYMVKAGTTYKDKSAITEWPASMQTVVNEICHIMGVTLDNRTFINPGAAYKVDYPNEDVLISEILSNIAAAHGGNWIMSECGQLRLVPLASPVAPVSQNINKAHRGYTAKGKTQKVSSVILSDSADNIFVAGDDSGISISAKCDYAIQNIADALCCPHDCSVENGTLRMIGNPPSNSLLQMSSVTVKNSLLSVYSSALYGVEYEPYAVDGAYMDPALELGDVVTVIDRYETPHNIVLQAITMNCTIACTCDLSAGINGETEDEYPYISLQELSVSRSVKTTQTYFGNRINRSEGFVSELLVDDEVQARFIANGAMFKMSAYQNGDWIDGIYFDPIQGKYVITGDVIINGVVTFNDLSQSGSTIINGNNITTGTIKAERLDLSNYSSTEQTKKMIETAGDDIKISVKKDIADSIDEASKKAVKVFTETPVPPYHIGDLWFGNEANSYTANSSEWLDCTLDIPPEICGDINSAAVWLYFYKDGDSYKPNNPKVGEYWYKPDLDKAYSYTSFPVEVSEPWVEISSTSDIFVFLKSYYTTYLAPAYTVAVKLYCQSTAPNISSVWFGSLWYQPGSDIKVCIVDNETDNYKNTDWKKRDGYADLPVLNKYRAEIHVETDKITSVVSAQSIKINEQTGTIDELSKSVSKIEQDNTSIHLSVNTLTTAMDDKIAYGEICAQIKIETTEKEGVVEIGADRLVINSTNFKLDGAGTVTASGTFTTYAGNMMTQVTGGQINFRYSPDGSEYNAVTTMSIFGGSLDYYGSCPVISMSMGALYLIQPNTWQTGKNVIFYSGGMIDCGHINTTGITLPGSGMISFQGNYGATFLYPDYNDPSHLIINGNVDILGALTLNGGKFRTVKTEHFGERALSAMESTAPVFSDMGRAELDETGFALVALDAVFSETVEADYQYHVFLSAETENAHVYVSKRTNTYFAVQGTPYARFSWLIFLPQRGYTGDRLPLQTTSEICAPLNTDISDIQRANVSAAHSQAYMENRTAQIISSIM